MNGLHPAAGEDPRVWTAAVFAAGDYAGVAMFGDPDTWQHRASRALLVGDDSDLEALRADAGLDVARLHLGAALWIHGRETEALPELEACPLPQAQALAGKIRGQRIQVLAQLPWLRNTPNDLLCGAAEDPFFELRNVSYAPDDLVNQPYADVRRFLAGDFSPDFYICAMAEWHDLPPNLTDLACPLFGHIADHDLHIQTLHPWLRAFDEVLVTDRSEWLDVYSLSPGLGSRRSVTSFPKAFGLSPELAALPQGSRPLDFFVSGTMLDSFHPDKAALMHELMSIPDIEMRVLRGFAGNEAYQAMLGASAASFTYVRRPGAMPTRGLESLAMGCAVATQEESVLRLWASEAEGVVPYGAGSGSLAAAVQRILADRPGFEAAARRGAKRIREAFDLRRVGSQYLRFLAFRAAAPRPVRQPVDLSADCQKRSCVRRTWIPASPGARRRKMQANFRFLAGQLRQAQSPGLINDMARELFCEFAWYEHEGEDGEAERGLCVDALKMFRQAQQAFPRHLVLRFNLVRTTLLHGSPEQRAEALQLAYDTLADAGPWELTPDDDVMPFDFDSEGFNYRDYLDLVTRHCRGEKIAAERFCALILASLAGYLGRKTGMLTYHRQAAELDSRFARYRLELARALLRRAESGDQERAVDLLEELARGSVEFPAALELLSNLGSLGGSLVHQRLLDQTLDTGVQPAVLSWVEVPETLAGELTTMAVPAPRCDRIAVLVPLSGSAAELAALLGNLQQQSIAPQMQVRVCAADGDAQVAQVLAACQASFVDLGQVSVAGHESWAARLNACVAASDAPLLGVAMPGDRFRADALETLVDHLEDDEELRLATCQDGWVEQAGADFEIRRVVSITSRPRYGRRRQFATDGVGLHPVWRRRLHAEFGSFDPDLGAAAEYEFWLRTVPGDQLRQVRAILVTSEAKAPWRRLRDVAMAPADMDHARRRHWPARAGAIPALQPSPSIPAVLFAPAIQVEAESHAHLGLLSQPARQQAGMTEAMYGTALMHGDLVTAELMLESCIRRHPGLLSARLAYSRLRGLRDPDRVIEMLRDGLAADPYAAELRRQLALLEEVADEPRAEVILPCPR